MVICAVKGCHTRSDRGNTIAFFRIPRVKKHQGEKDRQLSEDRRRQFLANIYRTNVSEAMIENMRICARHFVSGRPANFRGTTNVDWAPTLLLGHNNINLDNVKASHLRNVRAVDRRRRRLNHEAAQILVSLQTSLMSAEEETGVSENITSGNGMSESEACSENNPDVEISESKPIQETCHLQDGNSNCVDCIMKDAIIASLDLEIRNLRSELYTLRKKVSTLELTEDTFRKDDAKVKFYTGIHSFAVLLLVFNSVNQAASHCHRNSLTLFQEYLLTLMKLRLNVPFQDLSYRFCISINTASRIFNKWIKILEVNLKQLIIWPEREALQKTMPLCFRQSFGVKTAVIIDCFEIPIERAASLTARAITWSQYKHSNTVKFLIGITPQGTVSYVSKGWGGRVSDKHLTENCGILSKLSPGDLVLADRGFTIADSVGLYCAKLAIPAFTKGKKQLSALDVAETRKIANVRIHVERVIGLVRQKYTILSEKLSFNLFNDKEAPLIDDIVTVCCALTNLCPSVVPQD